MSDIVERLMRDVDPAVVAEGVRRRVAYARKTQAWGTPARCKTGIVDGDGSCVACGADQGVDCRARAALDG